MTHVHIIGARCSGKSTYVAALAGWNKQKEVNLKINIEGVCDEFKSLSEAWEYIVLEGNCLSPTGFHSADGNNDCFFKIDVRQKNIFNSNESVEIYIVDNPGEIFREIGNSSIAGEDLFFTNFYHNIINYLQNGSSLLMMIDCNKPELDYEYAQKIDLLLTDIFEKNFDNKWFRVALVFSKCDRSYMWLNRHMERQIIKDYSRVTSVLKKWSSAKNFLYKSFLTSNFGGLSSDPSVRNSIKANDHLDVLRDPSQWKPYGSIAPIYWLSTGKDLKGIDCY